MDDLPTTEQLDAWTSTFGQSYTDRNTMSAEDMDEAFAAQFGVPKSAMYRDLVGPGRLAAGRALEVGCNIGLQLELLAKANPALELHGVEPQAYALERARTRLSAMQFHLGDAFALPFADATFDLVFTHGVLIHIHPTDLRRAIGEIHRVSRRFVLCHEYYAPDTSEVKYHGQRGLLWKTDFARRFKDACPDLRDVDVRLYPYSEACGGPDLVDQVALLEKEDRG